MWQRLCTALIMLLSSCLMLQVWADDGPAKGWPSDAIKSATACVEATDVMRREHMHLLTHQRDRTMYLGNRERQHSLAHCVECHVNKDNAGRTIPVNAPGQFCAACHAFTAVTIDCFECHATRPDSGTARSKSSSNR